MNISSAAALTGLTAKTIRYYESIQLITPAQRQDNGYRDYLPSHIEELNFISHARGLGFTLKECAELLSLYRNRRRKSHTVKKLTINKIAHIDNKIAQLTTIRDSLKQLAQCCHGDEMPVCPILDHLSSTDT
ncbi:Cu(I)-responsive transcriptional regulator [Candidatus Sororendozoicomonas aggregata]|uniref:Cu(I)-responsive transcriptional regulator n=1 Tax=Candidatus Sororendozoicomonas aggregata TaxID=3073239 RepID=UPI002ED43B5F